MLVFLKMYGEQTKSFRSLALACDNAVKLIKKCPDSVVAYHPALSRLIHRKAGTRVRLPVRANWAGSSAW